MASSIDEQILRTSKEIVVKFIESGRLSYAAFPEIFKTIYNTVEETVKGKASDEQEHNYPSTSSGNGKAAP